MRTRRIFAGLLLAGFALLVLTVGQILSGCSSTQWGRFKAHGAAVGVGVIAGGAAVATGGTAGLLLAGGGLAGGVLVDQTLEPEPEVHTKSTTTVVQIPPPLPDGSPQKPRVDTYSIEADGSATHEGARGNLKLPAPDLPGMPQPPPATFWERVWIALQVVWWVVVGLFVLIYALKHPKVRGAAWGCVCWFFGALWRLGAKGVAALLRRARTAPAAPEPDKVPGVRTEMRSAHSPTPSDPINPQ